MPVDLDKSTMSTNTGSAEASVSSTGDQPPPPPLKKKRNQPGMPDPEAEVIALSPTSLLATNRFVCEICNKGFQRDQNLQLHRRGHNLPWKLRQRSSKEVKKKVYVCPEPSCVHHDPARALGDLTGVKKHFCRKHGEKKWKCDRCNKKYAVQSDWKAHGKICGTKEYMCDCGARFSRRDSFVTHRAFCDALAEESARTNTAAAQLRTPSSGGSDGNPMAKTPPPPPVVSSPSPQPPQPQSQPHAVLPPTPPTPPSAQLLISPILPIQPLVTELSDNPTRPLEEAALRITGGCSSTGNSNSSGNSGTASSGLCSSLFASSTVSRSLRSQSAGLIQAIGPQDHSVEPTSSVVPISLCLATSSLFSPTGQEHRQHVSPYTSTAMSATALLQKAAQMGSKVSGGSFLCGVGLVPSSSSSGQAENLQWGSGQVEPASGASVPCVLGLGIHCDEGSGLKELMMEFGPKQPTLDFLGLGIAAGGTRNPGLSALITSIGGSLDVSAAAAASIGGRDFNGKDAARNS